MITKEKLLDSIKSMPEEKFNNIDEIIEEIILLEKIENSLDAVGRGEVLSEDDVDKEISKW